jgi:hypothetical protein
MMSRKFSIRPEITFKGRQFKGLRGWASRLGRTFSSQSST